jgi:glycosyltransferase involved in cell wall biosynthesis
LLPEPTVFTLFHVPGSVSPTIERFSIRASFLNQMPFARRGYRQYLPLFPRAVESFDLSGFDLVVSSSHCVAKSALAPPGVAHLCYCHTPMRYAYEQLDAYFPPERTRFSAVKRRVLGRLRAWDRSTAGRPTRYLANSTAVADRIRRHYGREATVVHPPVNVDFFQPSGARRGDFLLTVGALVPYKKQEHAISAAQRSGRSLVIVGRGPEEGRLRRIAAGSESIRFAGEVSPEELRELYRACAFFVQPGEEDFGIASVEALACGTPVVGLGRGGIRDIVGDGREGALSEEEGPDGIVDALGRASATRFDYTLLRRAAERFSTERFREAFRKALRETSP